MSDPEEQPTPDAADEPVHYEVARDELAAVVSRLEAGGLTLEESLELWERGESLAAACDAWLQAARVRLDGAGADPADPDPSVDGR